MSIPRMILILAALCLGTSSATAQCGSGGDEGNEQCTRPDDDPGCDIFPELCPTKWKRQIQICLSSPLVIDLDKNGFHFSGPDGAVYFDLQGSGEQMLLQWVSENGDDAFLVQDLNENGIVDDGSELFGNGTRMLLLGEQLAINGFVGLSQFDDPLLGGNDDGRISSDDDVWQRLLLWLDANADGISSLDEMTPIDETALSQIGIIPRESRRRDAHGNWLRYWSRVYLNRNHSFLPMVDVYFKRLDLSY